MDMRKVIDNLCCTATEHVDQGLSLTALQYSKGLYEWKSENKQTTLVTCLSFRLRLSFKIQSALLRRTFTDDMVEVGANQCESCVIYYILDNIKKSVHTDTFLWGYSINLW